MSPVRHLEIPYGDLEEPIRITASMGIARLQVGDTAVSWIERADRAAYQAKDGGRDRSRPDRSRRGLPQPDTLRLRAEPSGTLKRVMVPVGLSEFSSKSA